MTILLYLEYQTWSGGDVTILLTDGNDGFRLLDWVQGTPNGTGRVIETFTVSVEGTSHDNLAANLQALDDLINLTQRLPGRTSAAAATRLIAKLDDETLRRSAFVYNIERSFGADLNKPPVSPGNYVQEYVIVVERHELWEMDPDVDGYFSASTSSLSVAGGLWNFSAEAEGDNPGNAPARIRRTFFEYLSGSGSGTATEFWWGWKAGPYGSTRANFISTWECEDGLSGADTSSQADANASGGNMEQCTFAGTPTKATRSTTTITDATGGNEFDQRGRYTVLLRAKTTNTRVADVWLKDGIENLGAFREYSRVRVSNTTAYMLHTMGTVQITPYGAAELAAPFSDLVKDYALRLDAASVTGAGNLLMDCFYLVPADEGACYVSGGGVGTAGDDLLVTTEQNGQHYVFARGSAVDTPPALSPNDYALPIAPGGGGRMVLCAQTATAHNLNDVLAVTINYSSRWPTLRGAADT